MKKRRAIWPKKYWMRLARSTSPRPPQLISRLVAIFGNGKNLVNGKVPSKISKKGEGQLNPRVCIPEHFTLHKRSPSTIVKKVIVLILETIS